MDEPKFHITKDDVSVMLKFLRHTAPEYATPEKAIFLLNQQHIHYETLEDLYPELIEEILKDFEAR